MQDPTSSTEDKPSTVDTALPSEKGPETSSTNDVKTKTPADISDIDEEKASMADLAEEAKQESSSNAPQEPPAQTLTSVSSLNSEGDDEGSNASKSKSASDVPDAPEDMGNENPDGDEPDGEGDNPESDTEEAANDDINNSGTNDVQSSNNSTTSDFNNASNMQQLQAINAYNNFMTQAAAAGAANNSQQYGMHNLPAAAPLVPDATNAPLITTLLLSVANQQPGLVPQITNNAPAPVVAHTPTPLEAPAPVPQQGTVAQSPTQGSTTVGVPANTNSAPGNAPGPTMIQAPQGFAAPRVVPAMGIPFHHPAANMLPFAFLLPQQMAMVAQQQQQQQQQGQPQQGQQVQQKQQQQQQQVVQQQQQQHQIQHPQMQRFAFPPGAPQVLTIPQGLQLPQMAANNFHPFNMMAALQQQQVQQQQVYQQVPQMNQVQYMPSALPQTVLGTSSIFAPSAAAAMPADATMMMGEAPASANGRTLPLYLEYDDRALTEYQCLLRQQIELFEATEEDVRGSAQGRHTRIRLGQVGIRCRHCAHLPKPARARGAVYYSKTIDGMYQVAQNMSKLHLIKQCHKVSVNIKNKLVHLQKSHTRASGGKEYWAEGLRVLGVVEIDGMLKFKSPPEKAGQRGAPGAPMVNQQQQQQVANGGGAPMQLQPQMIMAPPPTMPVVMEKTAADGSTTVL